VLNLTIVNQTGVSKVPNGEEAGEVTDLALLTNLVNLQLVAGTSISALQIKKLHTTVPVVEAMMKYESLVTMSLQVQYRTCNTKNLLPHRQTTEV
jgi:hypothetical protein